MGHCPGLEGGPQPLRHSVGSALPTARPMTAQKEIRLCKCGKQSTLPTFAQPPRLRNTSKRQTKTDVYTKYWTLTTSIPTLYDIVSRLTCLRPAPTCVPSRCCSDIATLKKPRSTCISPSGISAPPPARSMHSRSRSRENRSTAHEPASSGDGRHHSLCRTVLS